MSTTRRLYSAQRIAGPDVRRRRVAVGVLLAVLAASVSGCYSQPDAGKIEVIRNGGPFDNHKIRQVVCPGSGNTWVGVGSSSHAYPDSDQQRLYKLDDTKDADAPPISVFSKDGVRMTVKGTVYLKTGFNCSRDGTALVRKFDEAFVTRPVGQQPWEDWGGWLNATALPVIDSNMRQIFVDFECRQLVSSCSLVQNTGQGEVAKVDAAGAKNGVNVTNVQNRVQAGLRTDLKTKLGEDYFRDIVFNLQSVELPGIQAAIDDAQRAFASVSKAQADKDKAHQERLANIEKQKGYNACHSCARQDELGKLPSGLNTLVFGGGSSPIAIGGK